MKIEDLKINPNELQEFMEFHKIIFAKGAIYKKRTTLYLRILAVSNYNDSSRDEDCLFAVLPNSQNCPYLDNKMNTLSFVCSVSGYNKTFSEAKRITITECEKYRIQGATIINIK